MRELEPFHSRADLEQAIDNGGRFYNLFTRADDRVVTKAELAKAAGVLSAGTQAFLFLEMARQDLGPGDRESIVLMLDPQLRRDFERDRPRTLAPSAVEAEAAAGDAVIVTGCPRFVEDRTRLSGFITVPISTGKITTFTMIPIFDKYDVYELFDGPGGETPSVMAATGRGEPFAADVPVRFGGVLKEFESDDKADASHRLYLDTVFYTKRG